MPFYTFTQNNSGGHYHRDDKVTQHVIIEADTSFLANKKAEEIGIYFNGCEDLTDCPCCGDRWYKTDERDADEKPSVYGVNITDDEIYELDWMRTKDDLDSPFIIVYYLDGTVEKKGAKQ